MSEVLIPVSIPVSLIKYFQLSFHFESGIIDGEIFFGGYICLIIDISLGNPLSL